MGCICCYYQINNCAVPQGRQGALAPWHKKNMAKQNVVERKQKNKPSFAPTSVLYDGLRASAH